MSVCIMEFQSRWEFERTRVPEDMEQNASETSLMFFQIPPQVH